MADADSIAIPPRVKDLTGKRFGRLTAMEFVCRHNGQSRWLCRCDCGEDIVVASSELTRRTRASTQSCGCLKRELTIRRFTRHGMANSKEYRSWQQMIKRCYDKKKQGYERYGGRGITVCDRWRTSIEEFLKDMGPKPSINHSIERINNDGNYEPGNCVWATSSEQARNRRTTVRLTLNGKTLCLAEWAKELSISTQSLWVRLNRLGWSVERALTEPVRHPRAAASSAKPSV